MLIVAGCKKVRVAWPMRDSRRRYRKGCGESRSCGWVIWQTGSLAAPADGRLYAGQWGVADFDKAENLETAACAMAVLSLSAFLASIGLFRADLSAVGTLVFCVCELSFLAASILAYAYDCYTKDRRFKAARKILKPLRGKDPYLDLRAAAFLTVGAMPEWLLTRMCSGDYRGWK